MKENKVKTNLVIIMLFVLLIPFFVCAETCDTDKITIESIKIENKSDNVEEINEATAVKKNIKVDLSMINVGDNIEYKMVVKNDSNEDYELNETSLNVSSDYINYSLETDDDSNIIKAKSSRIVTLKINYKNEVPEEMFENGTYIDNKIMKVNLSNGKDIIDNPITGRQSNIIIIILLIIVNTVLYFILRNKKYSMFIILILGLGIVLPINIYALCKCEFTIDFNITIKRKELKTFTIKNICGMHPYVEDPIDTLNFEEGMVWSEWVNSEYNTINFPVCNNLLGCYNGILYGAEYNGVIEEKEYIYDTCIAECVSPESNILSSNNRTIKAKNIKDNDDIAYYDFNTNMIKIGKVKEVYIHKDATNLIKYTFDDNTYLESTDYHPIYTVTGWKSYTNRNGYPKPIIGDLVKTNNGYKKIIKIETYRGKEDYYDFQVITKDGKIVNNYFANGILVQGSY